MTTTATLDPVPGDLTGLEPDELLACLVDAEAAERRAGLAKLRVALQWCVVHPASAETGPAIWSDAGLPGLTDCDELLGGQGCPAVSAFAPEPFAAALGVSTLTGMQLLADALDIAYRLPLTWRRVQALEVPGWKARRLAQATHHLSAPAAAHVDARVAARLHSCGARLIERYVADAAARFDPPSQAEAEQSARSSWDVTLTHRDDGGFAGTSHLQATGDTVDLTSFYDVVCDHAAQLAALGDSDDLGARKAKALGVIASQQSQLDLYGSVAVSEEDDAPLPVKRPSLAKTRLYVHLSATDLLGLPDGLVGVGEVERLGPVTVEKIREWVGSTRATVVPVLHLTPDGSTGGAPAQAAVDEHDPPAWMRETVILRDRHCVFPWCNVDARACDLDHIDAYVPIDEGGPPGQTSTANLAALCRRHHNAKTSRRWRYRRDGDGTYLWAGPYGRAYQVSSLGTTAYAHA